MNCVKCGKETQDYPFRVLEVQTLHVRDLNREKKVQALGDFHEFCVCGDCAREKHRLRTNPRSSLRKVWLLFGLITLAGLILAVAFWHGEGALRLLGLGMTVGGMLCIAGQTQSIRAKSGEIRALSPEEAMYRCAWECLEDGAPKKNDINDITYIPVDETTLARKNGDLMILYDLLPEIAVEAHKRIHGETGEPT